MVFKKTEEDRHPTEMDIEEEIHEVSEEVRH